MYTVNLKNKIIHFIVSAKIDLFRNSRELQFRIRKPQQNQSQV